MFILGGLQVLTLNRSSSNCVQHKSPPRFANGATVNLGLYLPAVGKTRHTTGDPSRPALSYDVLEVLRIFSKSDSIFGMNCDILSHKIISEVCRKSQAF
jgi:hypothetical protein